MTSPTLSRSFFLAAVACAALAACSNKNVKKPASSTATPAEANGAASTEPVISTSAVTSEAVISTSTATTAEANIRGGEFTAAPELATVYFDYDRYLLNDAARQGLAKNATYLKAHPELDVEVAGNCDERGTVEYNLALGEKRAKAVREYYARLGISAKHLATISYGKEKPACSDHSEACWGKNRRADTLVRASAGQSPALAK